MKRPDPFYLTPQWRRVRKIMLEQAHYTCQKCGARANVVHHIKEYEDYPELGLDPENLMVLCRPCHEAIHNRVSKKPSINLNGYPEGW